MDDPFEWCEKINAFAASEVRLPQWNCKLPNTEKIIFLCLLKQIQDFKDNIASYLASLSAEINRRKDKVHQLLGIRDLTQYSDRELAKLYAEHSGVRFCSMVLFVIPLTIIFHELFKLLSSCWLQHLHCTTRFDKLLLPMYLFPLLYTSLFFLLGR